MADLLDRVSGVFTPSANITTERTCTFKFNIGSYGNGRTAKIALKGNVPKSDIDAMATVLASSTQAFLSRIDETLTVNTEVFDPSTLASIDKKLYVAVFNIRRGSKQMQKKISVPYVTPAGEAILNAYFATDAVVALLDLDGADTAELVNSYMIRMN